MISVDLWSAGCKESSSHSSTPPPPPTQATSVIVFNPKDTIFKGTKENVKIIFRVGRIQMNLDLLLRLYVGQEYCSGKEVLPGIENWHSWPYLARYSQGKIPRCEDHYREQ